MTGILRETRMIYRSLTWRLLLVISALTLTGMLAGAGWLLIGQRLHQGSLWNDRLQGELFLADTLGTQGFIVLDSLLKHDDRITVMTFRSKDDAARRFASTYGNDVFSVLGMNPLPASWVFRLNQSEQTSTTLQQLRRDYEQLPGVMSLRLPGELMLKLQRRVRDIMFTLLGLAALSVALSGLFTWLLTARALDRYRPESHIMMMMGASRQLIRTPFLLGGLLTGLISSGVTLLIWEVFQVYLEHRHIMIADSDVVPAFLLVQLLISLGSSALALRRPELSRR